MNNLKNRVQLIGHVGNDPEIKTFEGGKKLATITLATNDHYKNAKGEKFETKLSFRPGDFFLEIPEAVNEWIDKSQK